MDPIQKAIERELTLMAQEGRQKTPEERIARRYCELAEQHPIKAFMGEGERFWAWFRACMEEWQKEQKIEAIRERERVQKGY